jgi:hypothetical protein
MSSMSKYSTIPVQDRLLKFIDKTDTCWNWTGDKQNGYGRIKLNNKKLQAYRVAYETWVAPIPTGMSVHHKCANRKCVNPDHLELATVRENVGEMFARKAYEARIAELEAEVAALKDKYEPGT